MFDFLHKAYPFNTDLKYSLKLSFGMAIGVFLFILFFQPLELVNPDVQAYILIIAGFAGITLLVTGILKILLPWTFRGTLQLDKWDMKRELFFQFLVWILNSVAFSFYLAYVGGVNMTMYLAFKIVLICLAIPVLSMLINELRLLRFRTAEMESRLESLNRQLQEISPSAPEKIVIFSENRSENLALEQNQLILAKSAENYVEFFFTDEESVRKKLLRTTLRAVEDQLSTLPGVIRCHRTCIVNTGHVDKLMRTDQGIRLRLTGLEEEIPVSRQYFLAVKSALE